MSEVLAHKKPLKHELAKHIRDVLISSPADGEVLTYDGPSGKWKNKPPTPGATHEFWSAEGTTDISTSSSSWVTMISDVSLSVVSGKLYEFMFSCAIRASVAGLSAGVWMIRSVTSGGTPSYGFAGGDVYLPVASTDIAYNLALFSIVNAPFTGTMKIRVIWRLSSGTGTIYNDAATTPPWARRWRCVRRLDLG